jgi:hypothetical protein
VAVSVGPVLSGVRDQRDLLSEQGVFRELSRLMAPAADSEVRLLGLRCVDPQQSNAKSAADVNDDVDRVAVDDL